MGGGMCPTFLEIIFTVKIRIFQGCLGETKALDTPVNDEIWLYIIIIEYLLG